MASEIVLEPNCGTEESILANQVFEQDSALQHGRRKFRRRNTNFSRSISLLDDDELAEYDFYRTKRGDTFKYFFRDIGVGFWQHRHNPNEENKQLTGNRSPSLLEREWEMSGDSDEGEEDDEDKNNVRSQDVCGPGNLEMSFDTWSGIGSNGFLLDFEKFVASRAVVPVNPCLATFDSRKKTFEKWPIPEILSSDRLAEAGFYYTFEEDNVLCFHCGGGLKNWEVGDDPWRDHAKHFSRCGFVLQEKGKEFVDEVLRRESREKSGEMRTEIAEIVTEENREVGRSNEKQKKKKKKKNKQSMKMEKNVVLFPESISNRESENQPSQPSVPKTKKFELWAIFWTMKKRLLILREKIKSVFVWNIFFLNSKKLSEECSHHTVRGIISGCFFSGVETSCRKQRDVQNEEHKRLTRRRSTVNRHKEGEGGKQKGKREAGHDQEEEQESSRGAEHNQEMQDNTLRSQDLYGPCGLEIRPFSAPERLFHIPSDGLWRDFKKLVASRAVVPVNPCLATFDSRKKTFEKWPIPEILSSDRLAEAGFYYTFEEDNVLCFHCGGGLKNWEVGDDPWRDHAKHFSRCGFVLQEKGKEFVDEVLRRESREKSGEMRTEIAEIVTEENREVGRSNEKQKKKKKRNKQSMKMEKNVILFPENISNRESENQPSQPSDSTAKEIELCRVCYARKRGIVFLPCGHFVCCTECAPSLSSCAVCRKPFEAAVRAYLS